MAHQEIDIEEAISRCLNSVASGLREREGGGGRRLQARARSCTIFRIPEGRRGINTKAEEPELVSIGPYHRGQARLSEFEEHKWHFLKSFLRRVRSDERSDEERLISDVERLISDVERLIKYVADEARSAWDRYSEPGMRFDDNFMLIMILDGCFVVELLLQICGEEDARAPILGEQDIIPILIRDLLKLENQVPFSLLESLSQYKSSTVVDARVPHFRAACLKVFDLEYSKLGLKPTGLHYSQYDHVKTVECDHLLHLFLVALVPAVHHRVTPPDRPYRPSEKSIQCVTQLSSCGIKFKSKDTGRFLDISFRKRVLEIPSIAINDFMITVLINCIALEQCRESSSKHITDYVSFMHCLINEPKDVSLLCSDGIISTLSHDDHYVVNLFNRLVKGIVFNVNTCYLSKPFGELDTYYYSKRASFIRTYFSSPWAAIAAFSAFLGIALTAIQTAFAVLSYYSR